MAIELTVERIKFPVKQRHSGLKRTLPPKKRQGSILGSLGVPLGAYPNPSLYGERYSFKPKDTPYHNGRECPFSILVSLVTHFRFLL